jgi:hypothetical protein
MGTQHSLKETDAIVKRIAIDHLYHKTFKLLGMKCLMQCDGQHGNGPMEKEPITCFTLTQFQTSPIEHLASMDYINGWTHVLVDGPGAMHKSRHRVESLE